MKHVTTVICCIAFALAGAFLAMSNKTESSFAKHQTLSAATLSPMEISKLPYDLQATLKQSVQMDSAINDTVYVHDTTYVDRPQVLVINKKSSKVSSPEKVTDYSWMMLTPKPTSVDTVSNKGTPVREEKAGECDVGSSKESAIQLTVDGEVVYSKNVNHSTGESQ